MNFPSSVLLILQPRNNSEQRAIHPQQVDGFGVAAWLYVEGLNRWLLEGQRLASGGWTRLTLTG